MRHAVWPIVLMLTGCGGAGSVSPTAPSVTVPTPAPPAAPAPVVRTADLRGANGHATRGTARVIPVGAGHRLELGEDFATNGSRTVDVYLSREPDRPREGDLNAGSLLSRTGVQGFDLGDADVSGFPYVLVWCRPFQITIGIGELKPTP